MEFRTQRLWIRPIREADREAFLDLVTDPVVKQTYMFPDFDSREAAIPLFERLKGLSAAEDRYVAAVCLGDTPIGMMNDTERHGTSVELGYCYLPAYYGNGYATEALTGAIPWLFEHGFTEVLAGAFEENPASLRVMAKSGMTLQEHTDDIEYRGKIHKCIYYAIRK